MPQHRKMAQLVDWHLRLRGPYRTDLHTCGAILLLTMLLIHKVKETVPYLYDVDYLSLIKWL